MSYRGLRVLVTGSDGSIGSVLSDRLEEQGALVTRTDVCSLDVTSRDDCKKIVSLQPSVVFHLAGAKHAPLGESSPESVVETNTLGTLNVVRAAARVNARVVTASTCKACNPETAYGASKLIAERITLNHGGSVARFYNVVETQGNVFDIWASTPVGEPIRYTDCYRYFITLEQAVGLTLSVGVLAPGRYVVDPGPKVHMRSVAEQRYPDRVLEEMPLRRGDRREEPLRSSCESMTVTSVPGISRVDSPHDLVGGALL